MYTGIIFNYSGRHTRLGAQIKMHLVGKNIIYCIWTVIGINLYLLELPNCTCIFYIHNFIDSKAFLTIIDNAIKEFESMDILNIEAALLSRLIYRMKNKFRSDKGFKSMEKVKRALINYLNMAIIKDYTSLKSYIHVESEVITLPSRQLLEYVLVRTQGFAKLLERLEQITRCSANFLKMRIKLGHAWSISLIAYATISRIW